MLPRLALILALAAAVPPVSASAQPPAPADAPPQTQGPAPAHFDAPAYVSVVDGSATLERDGRIESSPLNMPLLSGDRLKTQDGRVEVRFADGGRLNLDSRTSIDVLSDDLVRLADGRLRVSVVRAAQQVSYRVDSPAGSVRILQPGDYRVALLHSAQDTQLEFAVTSGAGEIFTDQGTTPVRAGERAYASAGLLPSYAYAYNSANPDDFDRWVEMQHETVYAATSQSQQYLPQDMTSYAPTFDQYGDWRYQQTYGYVWYPHVAADWQPYYYGRWASYPSYGWTWVAADPFGYPTHHYGRWGFSANAWFWIPSAAWGPAYVSWAYAPSYVSWCPLGWNNYAVFSVGFYNAGPAYYSSHYHGHYYSAWTTVSYSHFGHGYANQHAVNWDHVSNGPRPHFTEGRSPNGASYAAARTTTAAPIRYGGSRATSMVRDTAVSRGSTQPGSSGAVNRTYGASMPRTEPRGPVNGRSTTETPRYINRGDQIVRSQTERPVAPGNAATRTAPSVDRRNAPPQGAAPPQQLQQQRSRYVWDNPASTSRVPGYNPPAGGRPSIPSTPYQPMPMQSGPRSYERAMPQAQPRGEYQRPGGYERPAERAAPSRPSNGGQGGDHAAPRSGGHTETRPAPSSGIARPPRGR